jgi:hypothetical protein
MIELRFSCEFSGNARTAGGAGTSTVPARQTVDDNLEFVEGNSDKLIIYKDKINWKKK